MKKLMTMIAAVATAFGLFAADTPDPSTYYSTSFESLDTGCGDGETFNWSADGWVTDCTDEFKLANQSGTLPYAPGKVRREEFFKEAANDKYLTLATGTNEIKHAIGGADRVFFDQLVKFTGFEEAPVVAEGTKIAVWMSATETEDGVDGATNLYVTAGTGDAATNLQVVADVAVDTWYRLTIKSLGNVYDAQSGMEIAQCGFLVYINGELATIVDAQKEYHAYPSSLNSTAAGYYAKGQLFTAIDTTSATLASVGYQGIGGVDDIIFSKDAPDFAASVNVTVAAITGAEIEVKDVNGNVIALTDGYYTLPRGAFTVTYTAADGYILPGAPIVKPYDTEVTTEVDDSDTVEPKVVVVTVQYDGDDPVPYADVTEALAAVAAYTQTPGTTADIEFKQGSTNEYPGTTFDKGVYISIYDDFGVVPEGDPLSSFWDISDGNVTFTTGLENNKKVSFDAGEDEYTLTFEGVMKAGSHVITGGLAAHNESITLDPTDCYVAIEGNWTDSANSYKCVFAEVAGYEIKEEYITDELSALNGYTVYSLKEAKHPYHDNYEIWDAADFAQLQADVAAGQTFAGVTFTLINDVTLTDWEGIGNNTQQDGTDRPFSGVFNGNGKTLTVSYAGSKKYAGFFNFLTDDAVVSNLTINASLGTVTATGEFGFAAVFGEAIDATIADVTVNGTIGTEQNMLSHNGAGIGVYVGGNSDPFIGKVLTIKGCVNNASIYTTAGKAGGFISNANGKGDVVFVNCVNNGAVTGMGSGTTNGIGGFIGYDGSSGARTFTDCTNTGVITAPNTNAGSFVGVVNSNSLATSIDGNEAQADILAIGNPVGTGSATKLNFQYATVNGNIATFVADDALAAGNAYKVMVPRVTPTFEFTEAGSISFDTNLVEVSGWAVTAVAPLEVTPTEVDGIVTFTAAVPIPTFDITIAETVNGKLETSVTNDVEAGTLVTVTATPDTGYELDTITTNGQVLAGKTFEMPAEDVEIAATFKKAGPVYPPEWPKTDDATKAKFLTWAAGKGAGADLSTDAAKNAFLLNCTVDELEAEKAAFKITKIEKVNGEWVITVKPDNRAGEAFNGKVVTKAFAEVGCKTEVPTPAGTETELFWEAFIVFPAAE